VLHGDGSVNFVDLSKPDVSAKHSEKDSLRNGILLALPHRERESLLAQLEWIDLPVRTILHENQEPIEYAYFVNAGLASVLTVMPDGKSVEVGLTGKEGFVGVLLLTGLVTSPNQVVMQVGGNAFRLKVRGFNDVLQRSPKLEQLLLRCAQELTTQATQTAACNGLHEVHQRLARWLLMSQDRLGGDIVPLTQQFLAHMLGTRRASVTVAAGRLQRTGMIAYNRGVVRIKNRRKLEAAACACYRMMRRQFRRWEGESKN
jgi:CRP-like cAMP-binding protein